MKRKNGFTLIELLAVIVILAIIAVIAVPIVINIIEESKENSRLRSIDFYLDAVENKIAKSHLEDNAIPDGTYVINETGNIVNIADDGKEYEIEVSGEKPNNGFLTIHNGQLTSNYFGNSEIKSGKIKMSVNFDTRLDEETGLYYVDVKINADEFIDSKFIASLGKLVYNDKKLTYHSYNLDVGSSLGFKINPYLNNQIRLQNRTSLEYAKVGNYATIVFTTENPELITADDFTYYVECVTYKLQYIPVEKNSTSQISVINDILSLAQENNSQDYLPGDINGDHILNSIDLVYHRKNLLFENYCKAMDVNGDGEISINDEIRLEKYFNFEEGVKLEASPITGMPTYCQ